MQLSNRATLRLLNFTIFGLAMWFFGNLYEEVILMPNWLVAPLPVLKTYQQYYSVVIQYHYYVPVTQLAVVALITLYFTDNPARHSSRRQLGRGSLWGLIGITLTAYVVLTINLKLFIGDLQLSETAAHQMGLTWMVLNGLRLACVGFAWGATVNVRDRILSMMVTQ